jgi:hypothetical protein
MEFKGQIIQNLFRILTPEEISELTTSFSGKKKVSLSLLVKADMDGLDYTEVIEEEQAPEDERSKAKIIPFDNESKIEEAEEVKLVFQVGPRVSKLIIEYSKVFAELDKKVLGQKRFPKKKSLVGKKQTSTLILEQKKKLHNSYAKIKSMEVLSLYKDTSSVDIEQQKRSKEDFNSSSKLGVLVDKKQA